jgi:hypothetical protein
MDEQKRSGAWLAWPLALVAVLLAPGLAQAEKGKPLIGVVTYKFGDAIYGNAKGYDKDDYLGRVGQGARLQLMDETIQRDEFGFEIVQVKVLSNNRDAKVGKIGWVSLEDTNFKKSGKKVVGVKE